MGARVGADAMSADDTPTCFYCGKYANELPSVLAAAQANDMTAAELARDDGTYNRNLNQFACDACYIEAGMPSSPSGWKVGT